MGGGEHESAGLVHFAELPITVTSLDRAVNRVLRDSVDCVAPSGAYRFINSYSVSLAARDPAYRELLKGPGTNLPDGKPLAMALAYLARGNAPRQVRGPSFFLECLDRGRALGVRHLFVGGTDELLKALVHMVESQFPGVLVADAISPPFRALTTDEREEQDARVRAADPHIVWVGLGTPKQDFEAHRIWAETGLTVVAVGAAFDFTAGIKREAPLWVQRLSLEWLFRLASEPRRLWRRYLIGNPIFLSLAIREVARRRR